MLDFTSALYLGLRHPGRSLPQWSQFTTGVPSVLASPPGAQKVAHQLAQLQGCERGLLGPSTFHLFWDLFGMLARYPATIYYDSALYPIARWGVERAAARGNVTFKLPHYDPDAFRSSLRKNARKQDRPILVTDSYCPACGKAAPLREYLEILRSYGGRLIVDDTQALGIFGHSATLSVPYGYEGGGMLPHLEIDGRDVMVISSLAKAFGVPVAVLSGSKAAVKEFEANSETQMHCSPPSIPVIHAAQHALQLNRQHGDKLRLRIAALIERFRDRANTAGFRFTGGLFPVQTLAPISGTNTRHLHERLLQQGVRTVLRKALHGDGPRISFVITARHTPATIDRAITALAEAAAAVPNR
jgi:8-amino-7-oxononanoate synthase